MTVRPTRFCDKGDCDAMVKIDDEIDIGWLEIASGVLPGENTLRVYAHLCPGHAKGFKNWMGWD